MEMVLKTVKRERSLREVRWGGRPDLGGRPAFQVQEMGERVALPRKESPESRKSSERPRGTSLRWRQDMSTGRGTVGSRVRVTGESSEPAGSVAPFPEKPSSLRPLCLCLGHFRSLGCPSCPCISSGKSHGVRHTSSWSCVICASAAPSVKGRARSPPVRCGSRMDTPCSGMSVPEPHQHQTA